MIKVALIDPAPLEVIQMWDRPPYPSIGLGYLSAFLKANGVETISIDASFEGLRLNEVKKQLQEFQPTVLGFTAMTHRINHVAKVAAELKKIFPKALTIVGGAHATVAPYRTLERFPVFEVAVMGEGELTLLSIVRAIEKESIIDDASLIKGIAWRYEGKVIFNQQRDPIMNLDSLPFPDYSNVKRRIEVYPTITSRGCPHKCIFCCRILGSKLRLRSPENVIDEVKHAINSFNPKLIFFADDSFTLSKRHATEICDLMIDEGLNKEIKWIALSRVTGVDQILFNKMREAGCIRVGFGVESGNQEILRRIKKGIILIDAEKATTMAKRAGLKTVSYFIIGHPYETTETIQDTTKFAAKLNTDMVAFGIMVPYPGTEVYEMAIRGDGNYKLLSENWDDFDKQIGNALEIKGLTRRELEKSQLKAYFKFYFHNRRFIDLIRLALSQRKLLWKIITKILKQSF